MSELSNLQQKLYYLAYNYLEKAFFNFYGDP
jgi:hypothetical protein